MGIHQLNYDKNVSMCVPTIRFFEINRTFVRTHHHFFGMHMLIKMPYTKLSYFHEKWYSLNWINYTYNIVYFHPLYLEII